jgi:hypothetical protein
LLLRRCATPRHGEALNRFGIMRWDVLLEEPGRGGPLGTGEIESGRPERCGSARGAIRS